MDAQRFKELQDDDQREGSMDSAIRTVVRGERIDIHTGTPGIIKEWFPKTQSATVQIALKRLFIGHGWVNLPQCVEVPVQFPRGGKFVITFPVTAGDECWLAFGERAIDNWWHEGGVQEPSEPRLHDFSDAVAHLGFSSIGRVPAGIATDALEIRTLDGDTVIRVEEDVVILGRKEGAKLAAEGETLANEWRTALKNHVHPETGGTTAVSPGLADLPDPRCSKVKVT